MANSQIDRWLNQIRNARYGRDVRDAIYNSINTCYSDVTTGSTLADTAAANADDAAASARSATEAATNAYEDATSAAADAREKASSANSAATSANNAASSANTAANNARTLYDDISSKVASNGEWTRIINNAATQANNAQARASDAKDQGDYAKDQGDYAKEQGANAETQNASMRTALNDWETASAKIKLATENAQNATTNANNAAASINNLTVSAVDVGPDSTARAEIEDQGGYKNIKFYLKQGATGAAFIIKGDVYASLTDLTYDITNPAVGDQYQVGTTPPYDVYRWSGTKWINQGAIGNSLQNLSSSDIDQMWDGSYVGSDTAKYIAHNELFSLIKDKIKATIDNKVDKISGKGLSTNDFTNDYKNQVDTNTTNIGTITETMVTRVPGKGLSSNDFTNAYRDKIDANDAKIGVSELTTEATNLSDAVNELNTHVNGQMLLHGRTSTITDSSQVTFYNSKITGNHKLFYLQTTNPNAVNGSIAWHTAEGSITFSNINLDPTYSISIDFYLIAEIEDLVENE